MASFQAPTNVLQALSTDCQKLLTEYDRMQSLRFSDFAKVWSNMNFGILLLCSAVRKQKKRIGTVDALLQIFLGFFSPKSEHELPVRVGAVYALYSIYGTQPIRAETKIRVTESLRLALDSFRDRMHAETHYDVEYVLRVLHLKRAYYYTFTPSELTLGSQIPSSGIVNRDTLTSILCTDHNIADAIINPLLKSLPLCGDEYEKAKEAFLLDGRTHLTPALSVANASLPADVEKLVREHSKTAETLEEEKEKRLHVKEDDESDSEFSDNDDSSQTDEKSSVLSRRQEIRNRAYWLRAGKKRQREAATISATAGRSDEKEKGSIDNDSDEDYVPKNVSK
ncbi:snRNA-activating protein complex subunit 1-like [Oscarella lobularis]|uniref:snRNA-activating protein complex subunit 1-like n=1 Tax=Oscarella lobularis TaxID=121494 RepID=UPI003313B014